MISLFGIASLKDRVNLAAEDPRSHPMLNPPAAKRIEDAADWLFREQGIRGVTLEGIAERAGTNTLYVLEHFGSLENLVLHYLKRRVNEQTREDERFWGHLQKTYPKREDEQLRAWVRAVAPNANDPFIPVPLTMEAIDFLYNIHHPGRAVITQSKAALRERLARLCCDAFYRESGILADKLLMLAEGAFVQKAIYGGEQPAQRLIEAAEDLFKRHWQSE